MRLIHMLRRHKSSTPRMNIVILEDLVPKEHILRKIDAVMNFEFIYDYVEAFYSPTGRPSIDPVVLIKLALLQHLDNRNSMRATFKEAEVNIAYRWFLGYELDEKLPHFSDFSKTYKRKFSKEIEIKDENNQVIEKKTIFQILFDKVLDEAIQRNYVYLRHVYMDSTHIKANANKRKVERIEVEQEARYYQEELDKEIDAYCKEKNIKIPKEVEQTTKVIKKSTVDADCGILNKGEHEIQAAYLSQTICDLNGFILGCDVNAANLHDSTTFTTLYQNTIKKYGVGDDGISSIGVIRY